MIAREEDVVVREEDVCFREEVVREEEQEVAVGEVVREEAKLLEKKRSC